MIFFNITQEDLAFFNLQKIQKDHYFTWEDFQNKTTCDAL